MPSPPDHGWLDPGRRLPAASMGAAAAAAPFPAPAAAPASVHPPRPGDFVEQPRRRRRGRLASEGGARSASAAAAAAAAAAEKGGGRRWPLWRRSRWALRRRRTVPSRGAGQRPRIRPRIRPWRRRRIRRNLWRRPRRHARPPSSLAARPSPAPPDGRARPCANPAAAAAAAHGGHPLQLPRRRGR